MFPTTGILDYFNRANENPLAGGWLGPVALGDSQLKLVSNAVQGDGGVEGTSYWNTLVGPDCECYVTLTQQGAAGEAFTHLSVRLADVNTSVHDGYTLQMLSQTPARFRVFRTDDGFSTQLGADINQTVVDGDKIGMSMIGSTITVYHYTAGVWSALATRTDSTYTAAGYVALQLYGGTAGTARADDFGGGSARAAGYQRIVGPTQFATSAIDLYTVPDGARASIRKVYVNNPTGSEIEFTLSVGNDAAGTRLLDQHAVAAGESYSGRRATHHALVAGEKIQGFADSAAALVVIDAFLEVV